MLIRALRSAADAVISGERDAAAVREVLAGVLATEPAVRVDYAEIVDASTLQPVERIERDTLIALAVYVGTTRLIDNIAISFDGDSVQVDVGLHTAGK